VTVSEDAVEVGVVEFGVVEVGVVEAAVLGLGPGGCGGVDQGANRQAVGTRRLLLRRQAQTTTSAARMVSGHPMARRATPSQPVSSLT
jgi:hypothetical protein